MTTNSPGAMAAPYLPTSRTFTADPSQLPTSLTKLWTDIASVVNRRTIGTYYQLQSATGNLYFPEPDPTGVVPLNPRQSFRQVYTLSAAPSATTATIATNIISIANATFVNIYGTAQSSSQAVPLMPWDMTRTDDAIYLDVNISTGNIEITTNSANWTSYSIIVVLEYLLN